MMKHANCLFFLILVLALSSCGGSKENRDTVEIYFEHSTLAQGSGGLSKKETEQMLIDEGIDVLGSSCVYITGGQNKSEAWPYDYKINLYQIVRQNLPDAQPLGFNLIGALPYEYSNHCSHEADSDRPTVTISQCAELGGSVVADIGDGNIHRADYICPVNGEPPLGTIDYSGETNIPIEGAVCCGFSQTDRPQLTTSQCAELDGVVVGDIGDGSVHRADYICPVNGEPPLGTIDYSAETNIPIEGAVCCGFLQTDRPQLTTSQCAELGGVVVGDIGDGSVHRADYICPVNGEAPLGSIDFSSEANRAIEGAVCCGT